MVLHNKNCRYIFQLIFFISTAIISCQKKHSIIASTQNNNYIVQVKKLYQLGGVYLNTGNDSLNIIADKLIKIGGMHKDTAVIVNGKMKKANYEWMISNYHEAMKTILEALAYAQNKNLKKEIPAIYGIIGNIYKDNNDYPMAQQSAQKEIQSAKNMQDTLQTIVGLLNLAKFTFNYGIQQKNYALKKQALPIYHEGLKLAKSNLQYEREEIFFDDELSRYYKIMEDYDSGIYYGNQAVLLALKYHQNLSLTYSYNWLGEIYFYRGDEKNGLNYLNKALAIAAKINAAYRVMDIHKSFYECYAAAGDDKNALAHYTRAITMQDSLQIMKNVKQIEQLQIQYETEKKDQQIVSLNAVNREKTKNAFFILTGLLIFLLLSVFLFLQYKKLRRRNQLLAENNRIINEQSQQLQLLMKELHHRVKNNLQIVSSLLSLQSNHLTDKEAQQAVKIGQSRIAAMSLIHRSLYQQENPNMVNVKEYITVLVESIAQSFGADKNNLALHLNIEIKKLDVEMALPLGLIINEWVTNAFKHAYKNVQYPMLALSLKAGNKIQLEIQDNGPGLSNEVLEKPRNSFGIKLIKVLSKQLNGECKIMYENGTKFILEIPVKASKRVTGNQVIGN